ncbi:MAG: phosphotransferase [Polyangiaceae bacterium]|nr:phosphotransferase [Polyangiaceae bacterium]MCB9649382.1 phosphotransferase [Deltaproteobacteria bacterium]
MAIAKRGPDGASQLGRWLLGSTARRFGAAFAKRRGFSAKLAQFFAFEDTPDEPELGRLFYDLPPLSFASVQLILRKELRQYPPALFAHLDPAPLGAASIAQVHAATLHGGDQVTIKVQYPSVAEAIREDTALLRRGVGYLPRHQAFFAELMDELAARLEEEVDFTHEAHQTAWFAERLDIPHVSIPTVYLEHSTPRLLVASRLEGDHLGRAQFEHPEARDRAGGLVLRTFWRSFFSLGRVHADLHPGNLLFTPSGDVGLVDFGATKAVDPPFAALIARLFRGLLGDAPVNLFELAFEGGLLGQLSSEDADRVFETAVKPFFEWLLLPLKGPLFDFGAARGLARAGRSQFLRIVRSNPEPGLYRDLLFLNRTVFLLYSTLEQMGATIPARAILHEELQRREAPAPS